VTLRQIEEYTGRAQEICADKTLDALVSDWQATLALERALEILGEAVKRLPDDLRDRYTQVEWRAITGCATDSAMATTPLTTKFSGMQYMSGFQSCKLRYNRCSRI
jgi:hypothetical protein